MNPTSIDVGEVIERCNRETVRFPGTLHGDVLVHKGEGATLYYELFRTEVRWVAEQGEEKGDEKTTNDYPFNVIRVARDADGKKMHLMFFSEHDDDGIIFDDLDEADFESDEEISEEKPADEAETPHGESSPASPAPEQLPPAS